MGADRADEFRWVNNQFPARPAEQLSTVPFIPIIPPVLEAATARSAVGRIEKGAKSPDPLQKDFGKISHRGG
jgi:hypothetical protein